MSILVHRTLYIAYFVAFFIVLSSSWISLSDRWNQTDDSYSHGYLVLAIFLFLVLRSVRLIDFNSVKPNYGIVPILAFTSLLWTLSLHAHIQLIQWLLLPLMLVLFSTLVLGVKIAWKLLFPILFLGFGIPVQHYFNEPLQGLTVIVVTQLLEFASIPVFIEAFYVTIPQGRFVVAGGCSGFSYMLVILTISSLYAYLNYTHWKPRVALIATAVLLGLITNWLRVFIIIVVGSVTDMQSSLIDDHEFFGWVLFAVAMVVLFFLAYKYSDWFNDVQPKIKIQKLTSVNHKITPYIVAFVCTFTLPLLVNPVVPSVNNASAPEFSGELFSNEELLVSPVFHGADITFDHILGYRASRIQASFRGYDIQKQGKELVAYNNNLYSSDWLLESDYVKDNFLYQVIRHKITNQKLLVASQFSIAGYKVTSETTAKLLEMLKPLMTITSSAVLILAVQCEENCSEEEALIQHFIADNREQIEDI